MMTFRVGAAAGATVSAAVAEYYLTDTLLPETVRAAEYYSGLEERADSFWNAEVIGGRLEMGKHHAELGDGLSSTMAARLGIDGQPLTQQRVANLLSLKKADGSGIDGRQIHRATKDGKKPPVGFIDLTFSASKSLSVAWALAGKEERAKIIGVHRAAVAKTMKYVSQEIGFTQRGGARKRRAEQGEVAWLGFQHYTSRPVDQQAADPNLHTHVIVLNHVLTGRGHIGAIDLARLNGRVHEFGAVYEAYVATEARRLGVGVHFDERRKTAQFSDIPEHINDAFSKRSQQAHGRAVDLAQQMGLSWDQLSEEHKASLRTAGARLSRQGKDDEKNDFASWSLQADQAGYRYSSVLGKAEVAEVPDTERLQAAYKTSMPMLEDEFRRRAVLDEFDLRRTAAQAMVTTGIKDAGSDIDATMRSFRLEGVRHEGQQARLLSQEVLSVRGKDRVRVTTALHVEQEGELIRLARSAAGDQSAALPPAVVDQKAAAFLRAHPEINAEAPHWRSQREMIDSLATGGRLGVVIGVAGSGKTAALGVLSDAWKAEGRALYGISLAWRQAGELKEAGISEVASIAAFLKRVESGRYKLDRNSVVVIDEVGLVGSRQMLDLVRIQERTGAQIVMIGDPRQSQAIEGSSALELLRQALGDDTIPRLLKSIRQDTEREREIAALFRRGKADEALKMKREDGTAVLVTGGRTETIQRVATLWRQRLDVNRDNPEFSLTVSAPTNANARELGAAIRVEWRRYGRLGEDLQTMRATDRTGETYDITLAVGDRVRLFDRVYDGAQRRALANNGDVVEIRQLRPDGMLVQNSAGVEGMVLWSKIRSRGDAPVRLAYGYALTVDVAQGSTASEHIHALPSGSQATQIFKAYTAATRHRKVNWLVIDEASERTHLLEKSMLGHKVDVTERDVWHNVATNVARHPLKPSATSVLRRQA